MPADLLKKERPDKELMRIGKHEHLKQLEESRRQLDFDHEIELALEFERSGPTLRMMRKGKRTTDTKKKSKKETFFRKGGGGGDEDPEPSITFGEVQVPNGEGEEESKSEEFDEIDDEESPKELVIAS